MAKYSADEQKAALAAGHAIPNANGDPSYIIKDEEDLGNAIHAVGRGGVDHDKIRQHIIARAKALGLSSQIPSNWNADGSLKDTNSLRDSYRGIREIRRSSEFELRDADSGNVLRFTGYASVTETPYERSDFLGQYTETIARGAFKRSLAQNPDVAFLVNHNDLSLPLARTKSGTMRLAEDTRGLHVEADLDPTNPAVQQLRSVVARGDADEMSFAFRIADDGQTWSNDYSERRITNVNIHRGDVSLVNAGSNPATGGTIDLRSFVGALREIRAGATLSASTLETLSKVLNLTATADDAVDQVQVILSDLMGVPNPDKEVQPRGMTAAAAELLFA